MRCQTAILLACCTIAGCSEPPAGGTTTAMDTGDSGALAVPTCVSETFVLEPGTGTDAFEPLEDGDTIEIVHGPQGGWHIEIGGRVFGTSALLLVTATTTVVATQVQITGDQVPIVSQPGDWDAETCAATFFNHPAFVDDHAPTDQDFICSLAGEELDFTIQVTDTATDVVQTAALRLVAVLDDDDLAVCGSPL